MKLKKILSVGIIGMMMISLGGSVFADEASSNPHISNQFEITAEEAKNNPTKEEIELKEEFENSESLSPRATYANGDVKCDVTSFVNLRSGPGTGYGVVTKLSAYTPIVRSTSQNGWVKVTAYRTSANGGYTAVQSGYIKSEYTTSSNGNRIYRDSYSATANLNVRSGPSTGYGVLHTLSSGSRAISVSNNGGFKLVWTAYNKASGYASSSYLKHLGQVGL